MKKIAPVYIVGAASLLVLIAVTIMLFRYQKHGRILSIKAEAASGAMYFEGEKRVGVNQPFKVRVMVNTDNQQVNAAGLTLHYDPKRLEITDMSTIDSFCQFYPEKKFDNRQGVVTLACGAPHPGFKGTGNLVEFTFMPHAIGNTTLQISNRSKILLSNGKGTNILEDFPLWEVQIGASL